MTELPARRETCWRVVEGPTGRLVICAIYENADASLELRVSDAADRILHSERLADPTSARARAEQWLTAFRTAGSIGR